MTKTELNQAIMKLRRVAYRYEVERRRKLTPPKPDFIPTTLCDLCANACGGCEWSDCGNMRPVPGWEAVRNDVKSCRGENNDVVVESYVVLSCPKFEQDRMEYTFSRETAMKFLRLREAGSDEG